ncbi:MAG TPA: ferrochelatase [Candidatus Dormibacteraeota bacterium]|nr:ferrochelatase [Candidatus Dormibacteraeota bacterium]
MMAYGSPRTRSEILPYYTHMRGGRPPSGEAVTELERRYDAIGGSSPLQEITRAQAEALERELRRMHGERWRVVVGMKHSAPFLEDAVRQLAEDGVTSAVGLVLAPHFSQMSVGEYVSRAEAAIADRPSQLQLHFVTDWHLDPGYIGWLADRVREQLAQIDDRRSESPLVIFTAHSLPARLKEMGDPYPGQLAETASAAALHAGISNWTTAWQSVARTGEPWLGPELLDVVRLAAARGTTDFVVCACGFTADHLEILYDLDVEAQAEANRLGVRVVRTPMPNARPDFVAILAELVQAGITTSP